jgi:SPP1 family predicted phage head-tail adaptor
MDRSFPIYLITEYNQEDQYGVLTPTLSKRKVYANVKTVSQSEWFQGGRSGLNPEYKMTMFAFDYGGENTVEYMGRIFDIYRTFQAADDTVELYCSRKQGKR